MSQEIVFGRCDYCSTSFDSGFYGNLLSVENCVEDKNWCEYLNKDNCYRCDVTINNIQSRYECKYVSSISDCVDQITVCFDDNRCDGLTPIQCEAVNNFCDRPLAPGETFENLGFNKINDGEIIRNTQLQISRCGTARTRVTDNCGSLQPDDQGPECLPFSDNYIDEENCLSKKSSMYDLAGCTDNSCSNISNPKTRDCCISESNCLGSSIGCNGYKLLGYKLCQENPELENCKNPCSTRLNYPEPWKSDICYYVCPSIVWQNFWLKDGQENFSQCSEPPINSEERICSEEYYNLCKLFNCNIDPECENKWEYETGIRDRNYPYEYPRVYKD